MFVSMKNIRVVVMDFDCTITREHTGGCAESPNERTVDYIRNNTKNGFVEFVRRATGEGIRLWIATYGDDGFARSNDHVAGHALVKRYMEVLLGSEQTLFLEPDRDAEGTIVKHHRLIARCSGDRKAYHWSLIREQLGEDFVPGQILFLDDQELNLTFARDFGCELMVPGSSDKSAMVCGHERLFEVLLEQMSKDGATDELG